MDESRSICKVCRKKVYRRDTVVAQIIRTDINFRICKVCVRWSMPYIFIRN